MGGSHGTHALATTMIDGAVDRCCRVCQCSAIVRGVGGLSRGSRTAEKGACTQRTSGEWARTRRPRPRHRSTDASIDVVAFANVWRSFAGLGRTVTLVASRSGAHHHACRTRARAVTLVALGRTPSRLYTKNRAKKRSDHPSRLSPSTIALVAPGRTITLVASR